MRDYEIETKKRIEFIRDTIKSAGVNGIVYGNSGGKDSTLVGILCKMACDDTLGIIMPCGSKQNYGTDKTDAEKIAEQFLIESRVVDLSEVKINFIMAMGENTRLNDSALANISPRLRMTVLYAIAANENRLVAGTGNRSESYMGYFTKWGDGAYDFNPIADLTVTEIYEYLNYLGVPDSIIKKAPSAGLFEGQTDEDEMGVTYKTIDKFLLDTTSTIDENDRIIIEKFHAASEHKRKLPLVFKEYLKIKGANK